MTLRALVLSAVVLACQAKPSKPDAPATECLPLLTCNCFSGCREVVCGADGCRPPDVVEGKMGSAATYRRSKTEAGTPILVPRQRNCYATCKPTEPPACSETCEPATGTP